MNAILAGIIFAVVLSAGILVLLEIGRRVGLSRIAEEGDTASKGLSAIEGAIFGLLGLILAFLFSGALLQSDCSVYLVHPPRAKQYRQRKISSGNKTDFV
jgi:hypothetical protein